jgi:hypothetical protein
MTDDAATAEALGAALPQSGPPEEGALPKGAAAQGAGDRGDDATSQADPSAAGRRIGLTVTAAVLVLASLFGPISASGIWEPHELKIADLGRRIAVALLGAKSLVIEGAVNSVPTTAELGRGELPFTSIALGLRLFGLSEWAGRLPLALWGLLGILATYFLISRLVDRAAAAFAAIVLATTPIYFLQSRTILGDIVTMASMAIATTGLSLAVFDTRFKSSARFALWLAGGVGLATGFGARGVILGVAVPAFSVGFAWMIRRSAGYGDRLAAILGSLCIVVGATAALIGIRAFFRVEEHHFSRLIGATLETKRPIPTHDSVVLQLGHAMFPWSAVVPFALGRLLRPPVGPLVSDAFERESSARVVILVVLVVAFGTYVALAPSIGVLPFGAVFALGAATALAFRDFERGAPGSRVVGLGVAALMVLFFEDFSNFPEKGLSAFAVEGAKFPESFKKGGTLLIKIGTVVSAGLFALFFLEREEGQPSFEKDEYRAWTEFLKTARDGSVRSSLVAAEVGLFVFAIVTFISDRFAHISAIDSMSPQLRVVGKYGFLGLPVLVASPLIGYAARDAARWLLRKIRVPRAQAALVTVAAFGAVMSFAYYPLLAKQISPKEVFDSYRRFARPKEELAMMGMATGGARYYARQDVRTFGAVHDGFAWLTERPDERRWLVVRSADIAQINSLFRGHRAPARNIPVLDARSSENLLVSNQLRPNEVNQNPFAKWVLDEPPSPTRRLDADFNNQLHAIGWDVTTPDGETVTSVRAGKPYLFKLYYEVTRPISGEWQTFVHVDGYQRRYNGDHDTLEGKYPFHLWLAGDHIVDIHPFELEPNFSAGTYTVFFGLFRGDQRLEVKRGQSEENRVNAGPLAVK